MRRLFLALAVFLAAPLHAQTPAPFVSPGEWMRALADDLLVPGHQVLQARTSELDAAMRALCGSPGEGGLTGARERWQAAAVAWRRVAALPIGPTLTRRSLRRLDFWPPRPKDVEAAIARATPLDRTGVSARGLPALEYLLFADARLAQPANAARCRYAAALAADIATQSAELAADWRKWAEQWPDAVGDEAAQAAMKDAINALVGSLERLRLRRLQKPRASTSRAELVAAFEGVEQALAGANRVLRGQGRLDLADRLEALARAARKTLQNLPAKVDAKSPARGAAIEALGALHTALATDVADALRVTIGFNEADGD